MKKKPLLIAGIALGSVVILCVLVSVITAIVNNSKPKVQTEVKLDEAITFPAGTVKVLKVETASGLIRDLEGNWTTLAAGKKLVIITYEVNATKDLTLASDLAVLTYVKEVKNEFVSDSAYDAGTLFLTTFDAGVLNSAKEIKAGTPTKVSQMYLVPESETLGKLTLNERLKYDTMNFVDLAKVAVDRNDAAKILPEMTSFLSMVQNKEPNTIAKALDKYLKPGLDDDNMSLYSLHDGVIESDGLSTSGTAVCYTVKFKSGVTEPKYSLCWKDKMITGIKSLGF